MSIADMKGRTIFHVDMDAFFASVEIVRNPALRGKPVIVGGDPNKRGVVATCSYEARAFGIHSAMPLFEAKQRCPQAIFLKGNHALYREYSRTIMEVFHQVTPHVQEVSIDEAYLDVTEMITPSTTAEKLAQSLKRAIWQKTQLPCTIGIASNKLVAKIASSISKPNGLLLVPHGEEAAFLAPLPVESIPGIGKKTQEILNRDGVKTIGQLQALSVDTLIARYGTHGYYFHRAAHGVNNRPVIEEEIPPKSISAETTFEQDHTDRAFLVEVIGKLVVKVCRRLRQKKMRAGGVTLKLRFKGFRTITRSHTLLSHTNQENVISSKLIILFDKTYKGDVPLRLVGVTLEKLTDTYWQPTLWDCRLYTHPS